MGSRDGGKLIHRWGSYLLHFVNLQPGEIRVFSRDNHLVRGKLVTFPEFDGYGLHFFGFYGHHPLDPVTVQSKALDGQKIFAGRNGSQGDAVVTGRVKHLKYNPCTRTVITVADYQDRILLQTIVPTVAETELGCSFWMRRLVLVDIIATTRQGYQLNQYVQANGPHFACICPE